MQQRHQQRLPEAGRQHKAPTVLSLLLFYTCLSRVARFAYVNSQAATASSAVVITTGSRSLGRLNGVPALQKEQAFGATWQQLSGITDISAACGRGCCCAHEIAAVDVRCWNPCRALLQIRRQGVIAVAGAFQVTN